MGKSGPKPKTCLVILSHCPAVHLKLSAVKKQNGQFGALVGLAIGLACHSLWMIFLLEIWPPRFLNWPSHTDVFHTTILIVPHFGWEIDPDTAGFWGIVFPLFFSLGGGIVGGRFQGGWLAEFKTLGTLAMLCGSLGAVNGFLLLLLACVED